MSAAHTYSLKIMAAALMMIMIAVLIKPNFGFTITK
jgi:hypothetical protein